MHLCHVLASAAVVVTHHVVFASWVNNGKEVVVPEAMSDIVTKLIKSAAALSTSDVPYAPSFLTTWIGIAVSCTKEAHRPTLCFRSVLLH